jgi:guanylate cyclase
MAESMRVRKHQVDHHAELDDESAREDDNVMKVFVTGGDINGVGIVDQFLMIICVLLTALTFGISSYLLRNLIRTDSSIVISSMPHIGYFQGAFSVVVQAVSDVFQMHWFQTPFENTIIDKPTLISRLQELFRQFNTMYVDVRFGNLSAGLPPYAGYLSGAQNAEDTLECKDVYVVPRSLLQAMDCFRPDLGFTVMESMLHSQIEVFARHSERVRLMNPTNVQTLFTVLIYPIYELLIAPMYDKIDETIQQNLRSEADENHIELGLLLAVAVIFEIAAMVQIMRIEIHMRGVLQLLLHCPAHVILQTARVMAILSNGFATPHRADDIRSPTFFRQVVDNMQDAVLTVDSSKIVTGLNQAAERLFGDHPLNMTIQTFLAPPKWTGNMPTLITVKEGKLETERLLFQQNSASRFTFEVSSHGLPNSTVFVFRDMTPFISLEAHIAAEKKKCDQLLRSTLPPTLVSRLETGEKNVSFAVQTITVAFINIVNFTAWCYNSTPQKSMLVLNTLFRKFDHYLGHFLMVTPIKTIGSTYIVAGGVFQEHSHVMDHPSQVVWFALECLAGVATANEELGVHIELRVGIAVDGPAVTGVIGDVTHPTFEILGSAVNVAQRMEESAKPGQVQITRHTYEILSGTDFVFNECAVVDIKGEKINTYEVRAPTL